MNRSLSSKLAKKASASPAPSPATANKKKKKKEQSPRNPLRDLNAIGNGKSSNNANANANASEASSSCSSSISVDAPRGCLRFFLSHSSSSNSKTLNPTVIYSNKNNNKKNRRPQIKTPKSAPPVPVRPSKSKSKDFPSKSTKPFQNPLSTNLHKSNKNFNSSCLSHYQCSSANKPDSRNPLKLKTCSLLNSVANSPTNSQSGSEVQGAVKVVGNAGHPTNNDLKSGGIDVNFTPLRKISTGLGLDSETDKDEEVQRHSDKSNSTTPPVQASVSPEIQCGSSAVSTTTLACYSAGHVLSGITDKRKCRSRGILNVGEIDSGFSKGKALGSFSFEDDVGDGDNDHGDLTGKGVAANIDASVIPFPTEASMHWLLSPCNEEDDEEEHSEDRFQHSVGSVNLYSPFSTSGRPTNPETATNCRGKSTSISPSFQRVLEPLIDHVPVFSSPHCTPGCEALTLKDEIKYPCDYDGENSPFSMVYLGSGNVIRTPQSDSSMDTHRKHYFDSELSSVAEAIQMASLSPNSHVLIEDQIDSSFQFDCLTTTCKSISRFQQVLDDRNSWLSNSALENVSQSEMRISWREGLVSCIYDMDEFDSCRCLSDEEEEINGSSNEPSKKTCQSPEPNIKVGEDEDQILNDNSQSAQVLDDEPRGGVAGKVELEGFPPRPPPDSSKCVCAESISTDGGGLLASGDSDWNLCYKNELFHV